MNRQPKPTREEIRNRYGYHKPVGDQASRMAAVRQHCEALAVELVALCPSSRELSSALSSLDLVMFQANAAIARNEGTEAEPAGT